MLEKRRGISRSRYSQQLWSAEGSLLDDVPVTTAHISPITHVQYRAYHPSSELTKPQPALYMVSHGEHPTAGRRQREQTGTREVSWRCAAVFVVRKHDNACSGCKCWVQHPGLTRVVKCVRVFPNSGGFVQVALEAAEAVVQSGCEHHRVHRRVNQGARQDLAHPQVEHVEDAPDGAC